MHELYLTHMPVWGIFSDWLVASKSFERILRVCSKPEVHEHVGPSGVRGVLEPIFYAHNLQLETKTCGVRVHKPAYSV